MLTFQKLDVYQCSIQFAAFAASVLANVPRGHGALSDQLRRASFSVPLNIAEGAGRGTDTDSARHYAIARGSAMECAAVLDVVHVLDVISEEKHRQGIELIGRIVSMLTKMCR
ncbi:MAG TPA: four helix bundle protein [Polyangiales bacterium]|nr:four helix bundle protein [Polyangiales bacterium]